MADLTRPGLLTTERKEHSGKAPKPCFVEVVGLTLMVFFWKL
jgi:hypothetical protein